MWTLTVVLYGLNDFFDEFFLRLVFFKRDFIQEHNSGHTIIDLEDVNNPNNTRGCFPQLAIKKFQFNASVWESAPAVPSLTMRTGTVPSLTMRTGTVPSLTMRTGTPSLRR